MFGIIIISAMLCLLLNIAIVVIMASIVTARTHVIAHFSCHDYDIFSMFTTGIFATKKRLLLCLVL